ncbi:hypothetical protein C0991_005864 [Blastosporella zonata]|nr:hypothetical protein C0991_005864 [Blastosporella zonata]
MLWLQNFDVSALTSVAGLAPNASLLGNDLKESALIDQWIHLAESELDGNTTVISNLLDGSLSPYNKSIHTTFTERERRVLKTLNDHLATRTFFVGERITLADIYVASQVRRAATVTFDAAARAEFNHLTRHLETIINQPKLKDIYEPNEFVEKALQYVSSAREKKSATSLLKAEKKTQPSENDEEEPDVPSRS